MSALAGRRFGASGWSFVLPTVTDSSPVPCVPGAISPVLRVPPVSCWSSWAATVFSLSHSIPGRKRDGAIFWPVMSASSSACLISGDTRVW